MSEPIRLLIADDHAIVREGLRTLLEPEADIDIVAEADCATEAIRLTADLEPDVLLLDLILPDFDGIEVVRQLAGRGVTTRIVMLTSSFGKDLRVQEAISAGATGYLLKDVRQAELLSAVRRAARGEGTLHPEAQAELIKSTAQPPQPHDQLTPRELDVLRLIADGQSNKRIAADLGLSEGTVKGYVSTVLDKLGVTDRTQAALYAVRNRLAE